MNRLNRRSRKQLALIDSDRRASNADFRNRQLPNLMFALDTDDYQRVEINTRAREHNESLTDLSIFAIATEPFYARHDGLNAPLNKPFKSALSRVYARTSVASKLQQVNRLLAPLGVEVLVLDGFRPIAVQAELWDWNVLQAREILDDPTDESIRKFALRFCSDPRHFNPKDPSTWPTHSTGGAVDLTLREIGSRRSLYMGGIYLDNSEVSATRFYEQDQRTNSKSDQEARSNRRLLYWAMTEVGFVNYPFEWWHFDYLTQASIMNLGFPSGLKAHYGLANRGLAPAEQPAHKRGRR